MWRYNALAELIRDHSDVRIIYIILFEYKAGAFPRSKIIPNPADPKAGSRKASMFLQRLDDDPEWELQPYDSMILDKDNMIIFYSEE